jgi:hypothetical protein
MTLVLHSVRATWAVEWTSQRAVSISDRETYGFLVRHICLVAKTAALVIAAPVLEDILRLRPYLTMKIRLNEPAGETTQL